MSSESTYEKISDEEFIRKLEKSIKDANNYCEKLYQEKESLIKYLESEIEKLEKECVNSDLMELGFTKHSVIEIACYRSILERVESGKYES